MVGVDIAGAILGLPKFIGSILWSIFYKIISIIPPIVIYVFCILFLIMTFFIGRWLWRNRESWRSSDY